MYTEAHFPRDFRFCQVDNTNYYGLKKTPQNHGKHDSLAGKVICYLHLQPEFDFWESNDRRNQFM